MHVHGERIHEPTQNALHSKIFFFHNDQNMTMVFVSNRLILLQLSLLIWLQHYTVASEVIDITNAPVEENDGSSSCTVNGKDGNDDTCTTTPKNDSSSSNDDDNIPNASFEECGVWVALSTLPGTGIGMFAGKNFTKNAEMMPMGDHIVPIVDIETYHTDFVFLWDEYTWSATHMGCDHLGRSEVNVASAGFGAAANSFMDFLNVDEGYPKESVAQHLHRSSDPGAGAFTVYHSRTSTATRDIELGEELFVSYGNNWFLQRPQLGPIPIKDDYFTAQNLIRRYRQLQMKTSKVKNHTILEEAWDTFVLNSSFPSRVFAAIPEKQHYREVLRRGLKQWKREQMYRSDEWLQQHGVCADNLHMKVSTIPQAGHGAFASRFLPKNSAILPIPLIHIPDRKVLEMYGTQEDGKPTPVMHQLLLNYGLGHRNTTMLLSPYGPSFLLVNHHQAKANVRLQWAQPHRSNHHPEMLEKPVKHFEKEGSAKLAMELVTLRDIQPNEEILLDYGDEWEAAWQDHVLNWKPVAGASSYKSASQFDSETVQLKTEFDLLSDPYPANVAVKFNLAFRASSDWHFALDEGKTLLQYREESEESFVACEILQRENVDGRDLYTVVIADEEEDDGKYVLIKEVPREAFIFEDRPHTTDAFLPNAFRHDIRIPDDIFPKAWGNIWKE